MKIASLREGTWDEQLVREAATLNQYRLPDHFPAGALVIDIGAHIGGFALAAAERGANVWCFEPDPENHRLLLENTAEYREREQITVNGQAVWRSDRETSQQRFNPLRRLEGEWGLHTGAGTCCLEGDHPSAFDVPVVPLDRVLQDAGEVAFMKLDCEFAEFPILLTSRELRRVRMLAVEVHEVPGPLAIEAQVGGVQVYRAEHLVGALIHDRFDVEVDRRSPWFGFLHASRRP